MSAYEQYHWRPSRTGEPSPDLDVPLPQLPQVRDASNSRLNSHDYATSLASNSLYSLNSSKTKTTDYHGSAQASFADEAAISLQPRYLDARPYRTKDQPYPEPFHSPPNTSFNRPQPRLSKTRRFFTWRTPWVTYLLTLIQTSVFIYELVHNAILTGSPIEIHPSFNPMIGPSPYVLINTGGRYVPCMRAEAGIQDSSTTIYWPCPNQTDTNPTCTLSELCGFSGVPNPVVGGSLNAKPASNQWFRFITPIFVHAGVVHIAFNMLLQVMLGGDMEKEIGHVRFTLVYFASGIFGFVMGGNFAANGIVSTGASGSLFGIIALLLLDLLYTWPTRAHPIRDLLFLLLDICVSFVLGLLPGLDNFSHIGGFLMGLAIGVCVLRSPAALRRERGLAAGQGGVDVDDIRLGTAGEGDEVATGGGAGTDFPYARHPRKRATSLAEPFTRSTSPSSFPRPNHHGLYSRSRSRYHPTYLAFTLLRAAALAAAVTCSVLLVRAFYSHHDTECTWCKYLSCLPIKDWCDIGDLTFKTGNGTAG